MAKLEDLILRDTTLNKPAAGVAGRLYYDTDLETLERDSGVAWESIGPSAASEVTADAVIVDHTIVRGHGGAKIVQDSGIVIDDSDNVTGVTSLLCEGQLKLFDAGGEHIAGDGTDLTITSSAKINLTAVSDVILPVSVGLILGDGAEKLESDNTDLTVNSGGAINLTATTDIVIPANVGITFGTGEKIEGDNTDLTVTSGGAINLTATTDVVVPANVGVTFGSGEKIEGDDTDLTVTSGGAINLTATTDVVIPANVGITFGTGEKIEGDSTDLTITSGAKINLTATSDVIVPVSVGIILGDGAEKLESDNTDLTINSGADINLTATTDINVPANVGVTFGDDGEKIEGDGTDLTITSGAKINLTATSDVIIPVNVGAVFGDGGEKIESDNTDFTITSGGLLKMAATSGIQAPLHGAPAADGYVGITASFTAGENLTLGQIVYIKSDGKAWKADMNASTTMPAVGIATAAANAEAACVILLYGVAHLHTLAGGWTVGGLIYAGAAGAMSQTAPSGNADQVQVLGVALVADVILFNPAYVLVEVTA